MNKRAVIFLMFPSGMLVLLAVLLVFYANDFFDEPDRAEKTEKRIEELIHNIQNKKLDSTPEALVEIVAKSWRQQDQVQHEMAKAHAQILFLTVSAISAAVVLQLYIVFRVRGELSTKLNSTSQPMQSQCKKN